MSIFSRGTEQANEPVPRLTREYEHIVGLLSLTANDQVFPKDFFKRGPAIRAQLRRGLLGGRTIFPLPPHFLFSNRNWRHQIELAAKTGDHQEMPRLNAQLEVGIARYALQHNVPPQKFLDAYFGKYYRKGVRPADSQMRIALAMIRMRAEQIWKETSDPAEVDRWMDSQMRMVIDKASARWDSGDSFDRPKIEKLLLYSLLITHPPLIKLIVEGYAPNIGQIPGIALTKASPNSVIGRMIANREVARLDPDVSGSAFVRDLSILFGNDDGKTFLAIATILGRIISSVPARAIVPNSEFLDRARYGLTTYLPLFYDLLNGLSNSPLPNQPDASDRLIGPLLDEVAEALILMLVDLIKTTGQFISSSFADADPVPSTRRNFNLAVGNAYGALIANGHPHPEQMVKLFFSTYDECNWLKDGIPLPTLVEKLIIRTLYSADQTKITGDDVEQYRSFYIRYQHYLQTLIEKNLAGTEKRLTTIVEVDNFKVAFMNNLDRCKKRIPKAVFREFGKNLVLNLGNACATVAEKSLPIMNTADQTTNRDSIELSEHKLKALIAIIDQILTMFNSENNARQSATQEIADSPSAVATPEEPTFAEEVQELAQRLSALRAGYQAYQKALDQKTYALKT